MFSDTRVKGRLQPHAAASAKDYNEKEVGPATGWARAGPETCRELGQEDGDGSHEAGQLDSGKSLARSLQQDWPGARDLAEVAAAGASCQPGPAAPAGSPGRCRAAAERGGPESPTWDVRER
uniref:cDNA n=1 Tax=Macrostomum lignano TaxID=282301 RepID=A0A1I8FCB2_9PLAT